jgi:hypothetical protein
VVRVLSQESKVVKGNGEMESGGALNTFTMSKWRRLRIEAFVSHVVEEASIKEAKGHNN